MTRHIATTVKKVLISYRANHLNIPGRVRCSKTYGSSIKNLIAGLGGISVEEIQAHLDDYIIARTTGKIGIKPAGGGTIDKELRTLQAALNFCLEKQVLPTAIIKPFKLKFRVDVPDPKPFFLERAQTYKLLESALYGKILPVLAPNEMRQKPVKIPRIYIFVMLGLDTAARYRTIIDLKWEQVDLAVKRIKLKPIREQSSSRKRKPTIAISGRLHALLTEVRKQNPDDIYVLGHNGSIRKSFGKAAKRAGLSSDITPHTLRHTFATLSLQKGITPFQVAQVMGDNVNTVLRVYGHHCPNYTHEAVNAMASLD